MELTVPVDLDLPLHVRPFLERLSLRLSEGDAMYAGNDRHYLSCGASALAVILSSMQLCGITDPASVLDFGAGAGRVTRWLRAAFPNASIDICDLRSRDVDFCAECFGAHGWAASTEIAALNAPRHYDLIWLGSVATHLSPRDTLLLIEKVASWCRPSGLVVLSFHGRYALARQNSGTFRYIDDESWAVIQRDYMHEGYGYSDYPGQTAYGISVTKPSWMVAAVEKRKHLKMVCLAEQVWDAHHDVIAMQVI